MVHGSFYRSRPTPEMAPEAITKAKEPLTHARQQFHFAVGHGFLTPSRIVPLMSHLTVPDILRKLALFFLIHKNQSDKSDKVELFLLCQITDQAIDL